MSKLHAQMALLGTIDEVVRNARQPETVKMVESFLPGTTGIGQQGWYRELKHFLSRKELSPRDEAGGAIERSGPVTFPSYDEAINELMAGGEPASPAVRSRSLFACTILSIATTTEGGQLPPIEGWDPSKQVPDPLDALMPVIAPEIRTSATSIPGLGKLSSADPAEEMKSTLRGLTSREEYLNYTRVLASTRELDPETRDVMNRPVVCTGSLRKVDGQFCTLLTTSWEPPFTISQIKEVIDPHNWPDLCDFFVSMTDQAAIVPDLSRGWTRVLESVSGDKTQWQMRTALRYWKGLTTPGGGIFINYDLDNPRVNDCKLLEVDAGYIWATPINPDDPNSTVRLRTCKQVRIRGVSSTATAALGCGFGWGDAMSQMFVEGVERPPDNRVVFGDPSVERPAATTTAVQKPADGEESDEDIAEEAEEVELLKGWRGAIIEAMRLQMTTGIEKAQLLGSEFAVQWSDGDGFSMEDVKKFGEDCGREMTSYAVGIFKEAAAALQPQSDAADATGGND